MDQMSALRAFVAVAESGGFAKAARTLGLATSSLTRQADNLERHLGVSLFNRSTRNVTLTAAGELYLPEAIRILEDLDEADRLVSEAGAIARGTLRVSLPVAFARLHVAPLLAPFASAFPDVKVEISATDSVVDLVEERIDVAIRLGVLPDSRLIARKLAPHRRVVCASPQYLAANGRPDQPKDLARHTCLCFAHGQEPQSWRFKASGESRSVQIKGVLTANNSEILREAALGGVGIILMPTWLVGQDLCDGRLTPLLEDWTVDPGPGDPGIYAVTLPNRRGSKKVRAFVDFLHASFGTPAYWDRYEGTP